MITKERWERRYNKPYPETEGKTTELLGMELVTHY